MFVVHILVIPVASFRGVSCEKTFWLISAAFPLPQTKERGSTRVHSLNNVNKALQVLHQNNVSTWFLTILHTAYHQLLKHLNLFFFWRKC